MKLYRLVFFVLCIAGGLQAQGLRVSAAHTKPNKPAAYKFEFRAENEIRSDAEIAIIFPREFQLSTVIMAASSKLKGGFTINVKQDTVFLKRTGLGNSLPANQDCDIIVADVISPSNMETEYGFDLLIDKKKLIPNVNKSKNRVMRINK